MKTNEVRSAKFILSSADQSSFSHNCSTKYKFRNLLVLNFVNCFNEVVRISFDYKTMDNADEHEISS